MVFWYEIDKNNIDKVQFGKDEGRWKYSLGRQSLRFQIPRGTCTWGVSAYKSFQIDVTDPQFITWWKDLESRLCPQEPFSSNLKNGILRMKIDDATYIFDDKSQFISPEIQEGLFKGQDLSCLVEIESNYFFRDVWGLTVRAAQVKCYGEEVSGPEPEPPAAEFSKGVCAFLPE
jgi:hypothetical protein